MGGGEAGEGLSKKENGLMDMDNSVVIVGWGGCIKGLNINKRNTMKIQYKI